MPYHALVASLARRAAKGADGREEIRGSYTRYGVLGHNKIEFNVHVDFHLVLFTGVSMDEMKLEQIKCGPAERIYWLGRFHIYFQHVTVESI